MHGSMDIDFSLHLMTAVTICQQQFCPSEVRYIFPFPHFPYFLISHFPFLISLYLLLKCPNLCGNWVWGCTCNLIDRMYVRFWETTDINYTFGRQQSSFLWSWGDVHHLPQPKSDHAVWLCNPSSSSSSSYHHQWRVSSLHVSVSSVFLLLSFQGSCNNGLSD